MSYSNTGTVDLGSVLNVGRRTLSMLGESKVLRQYTDTVYITREDSSNSILSIDSKISIFGETQFLYAIFERYTANINCYDEPIETLGSSPYASHKPSFSATLEEEDQQEGLPIVATVRKGSTASTKESSSPPVLSTSPLRKPILTSIGRSQSPGAATGDFGAQNLEGRRYGCIQIPNMNLIEILELLLRSGLEIVHQSSDYDKENVLHQSFILSKNRAGIQKQGQFLARSVSHTST